MTEEESQFTAACNKAEKVALRLIARAEQNRLGLTAKLEKRGFDAAVTKAVVSSLLDRNLLSDERYAELWLRSRLSSGKKLSPLWLRSSLAKRGIDINSSKKALKTVLDPETELLLLEKYLGTSAQSRINKAQLKREGFSSAAIDMHNLSL